MFRRQPTTQQRMASTTSEDPSQCPPTTSSPGNCLLPVSEASACKSEERLGQVQAICCGQLSVDDDLGYRTGRPHHVWSREFRKPWPLCESVWREYLLLASQTVSESVSTSLQSHTFDSWPYGDAQLLVYLRYMFVELGLPQRCRFPLEVLENWLFVAFCRYNLMPFHNFRHAFCVTQMMYCFIRQTCLSEFLTANDLLVIMFSAVSHDLDHPGFTNSYQVNARSWLALRYNDRSPLENHHCATAFDLISQPATNLVANLTPAEYLWFRKAVIRCILGTDLLNHADCMSQFRQLASHFTLGPPDETASSEPPTATASPEPPTVETSLHRLTHLCGEGSEERIVLMLTLVKACDISNELRPPPVAGLWLDALLDEFFHQAEAEKRLGLPIAPHMDPEKVERDTCQVLFIERLLHPVLSELVVVVPQLGTLKTELEQRLAEYTANMMLNTNKNKNSDDTVESKSPLRRPDELGNGQTPSGSQLLPATTTKTASSSSCPPSFRLSSLSTTTTTSPKSTRELISTTTIRSNQEVPVPSKCSRRSADDVVGQCTEISPEQQQQPHLPPQVEDLPRTPRRRMSQQSPSPTSLVLWSLTRLESGLPLGDEAGDPARVSAEAPPTASRKSSTGSMVSAVT